jgi:hypothetical protein
MRSINLGAAALSAIACLLACSAAKGSFISIDDTSPNDTITISVNDFEGGFTVNGVLIQQGLGNPGSVTLPETAPITFIGRWIDLGQAATGTRTIYLVEQNNPTQISDILQLVFTSGVASGLATIQGTFTSDSDTTPLGLVPAGVSPNDVFVEAPGLDVPFSAAFLEGHVQSDVDPATVPDSGPGVLGMLTLLGLCGFGYRRHLRCQTSAS